MKAGESDLTQIPFGPIVKVTVPNGLEEETEKERTVEFYVKNWEGMEDGHVPPPPPGMEKQYRKAKAHAEKMLERGKEVTCEIVGEDMGVKERRILSGGYYGEEEDEEEEEDEGKDTAAAAYFAIRTAAAAAGCRESDDADGDGRENDATAKSTATATTAAAASVINKNSSSSFYRRNSRNGL